MAISKLWYKVTFPDGFRYIFSSMCTALRVRDVPGIQTRLV
jgi:hypothetical protein